MSDKQEEYEKKVTPVLGQSPTESHIKKAITVYYDEQRNNWDEAITRELKRLGLKPGQCTVIALPKEDELFNTANKSSQPV
ncbi:MAG: hypothetical protein B6I22_14645 [Desulfobacteraceae bacterium 4572_123]|nr:MAG: hypothetical protein B6I22_14645 [Desulfobacteraceae bacterium 4572_123]